MLDRDLRLQVIWTALDKITGPLKKISRGSDETAKALKAASSRLRDLNAQQKNVAKFRELHRGLDVTRNKFKVAQKAVAKLSLEMRQTESPTREMQRGFDKAQKAAGALKIACRDERLQLQTLRRQLSHTGISTKALTQHERTLRQEIATTTKAITEQQTKLSALGAKQQRIAGAKRHAERIRHSAGGIASAGIGATAAGTAMSMPLALGLSEAKHYQTESGRVKALGLGRQTSADAIAFARSMKTFGTSAAENLELVRDAMSVFGDLKHAKMVAPTLAQMKFGNKAFYGEEAGGENERKFLDMLKVIELRGGTANTQAFHSQANMVQKVISATGGRVGPSEWLNFIKTGGVAAKGMDDKSFYYQMEPLLQELGGHRAGTALMSGYSNLYQGRTTKRAVQNIEALGLIGDRSKVTHDKVGQVATLGPGALLGSDIFRRSQFEWMEAVLLPQLAKKGITGKKNIEDTIGSLFSTRTAANQFVQMYTQRAQIHKNAKLNAGAYDIQQIGAMGKNQTEGQELGATAKLADLKLRLGEKILPLYSKGLQLAGDAAERLNGFIERNPKTTKVMITAFAVLAGILITLGPLMLIIASMIGPYALLHVLFAKMGAQGGVLVPILRFLSNSVLKLGGAFLKLGKLLLMNAIGLAITAIAVAAFLIYRYWEPISGFFKGLWKKIKEVFFGGIAWIKDLIVNWSPVAMFYKAFASVLSWFGIEMPAKFNDFGANLIHGLIRGIVSASAGLKTSVFNMADNIATWFKDKLGIHSPSRVFAALGDFTMRGLAVGLNRSEDAPINQVTSLARRLTQLTAGIVIGAATLPANAFDARSPLSNRAGRAGAIVHGDTIQITVHAPPGADPQAIARAVATALERRDREKAARARSSLFDRE